MKHVKTLFLDAAAAAGAAAGAAARAAAGSAAASAAASDVCILSCTYTGARSAPL